MSIIEKAAKRLSELRQAGIDLPDRGAGSPRMVESATPTASTPVRTVQTIAELSRAPEFAGVPSAANPFLPETPVRSRRVEIDLARLARAGYITPDQRRSRLADEFRVVKRPLLLNAQGKGAAKVDRANLVMVTSSVPGEGKTYASVNLALSIAAEFDNTVLLVDADTARPSVMERLGLPRSPGLIDILQSAEPQLSDCMLRTNIDKLTLLPSGSHHDHATELLASENMRRLLDDLATKYPDRIIVFDAPPLLPAPEARVLAARMGQIIFVVAADETSQSAMSEALATIESCPVVMTLLNKTRRGAGDGYYGYGGGYGYGYGT